MSSKSKFEPIAIVGSGCRFPGDSTNPSKLWKLLSQPRDVLSKIDRFSSEGFYHADGHHHGTSNVLDSYLLEEDPKTFDAQFFNIQAGEAESIDPQQRLLLETIYESMEAAGMKIEDMQGSPTAVYVGVMCDDYGQLTYHDTEAVPTYAATGSARSIMSNRISYFFDWRGPSMTIDTACSSSLVAVHQGVQVLRSGESRVAVAAGANLIFGPNMFIAESNLNMLSPTGRSRMWDSEADGYARGEGIASVIMKKLSDAIADGDEIECVIRETGLNQDGHTMGITMPSSTAQAQLIRDTYAKAGLDVNKFEDRCQYFEAHGTGTKAGDPQEARAIHGAFFGQAEAADETQVMHVGSIKTIIGHTEGTAGLAGVLKAMLAINNKTIPPNMHFTNLNPDIESVYGSIQIPTAAKEWPALPAGVPRRASVNSFGFGGANAHAIIESYEGPTKKAIVSNEGDSVVATPFTFSGTSEKALGTQLQSWLNWLRENPEVNLRDLSWTLSRRSAFSCRASFSATSFEKLCEKIEAKLEEKKDGPIAIRPVAKKETIMGVFTGQGAQWAPMGKQLLLASKFAESIIDSLEKSLADLPEHYRPEWSLKKEIMAGPDSSRLSEGAFSQPLCTAIQVVLVDMLHEAGINFDCVVGHSSGEIAAAYTAGFINAWDAIRIAYFRGVYAKLAKGPEGQVGAMMAVGTSMEDAAELCALPPFLGKLQVAASNSSASVTLSGDEDAVEFARVIFEDEQKFARKLKVDTAYHSHHMQPCSIPYVKALNDCEIEIRSPPKGAATWYSSVLGGEKMTFETSDDLKDVYWRDNMLKPVLFSQATETLVQDRGAAAIALEVGPHPALKGPASLTIEEISGSGIPYCGTLARGSNDVEAFSDALGFVWANLGGSAVNLAKYDKLFSTGREPNHLKTLPHYTFDKEKTYWLESRASRAHRLREDATHELLGVQIADPVEGEYRWRNFIKPTEIPWLKGHQIQGQTLFPAAGFAAMALEASKSLFDGEEVRLIELHDFSIHRALAFNDEAAGVETLFTLSNITTKHNSIERFILTDFNCSACPSKESGKFTSMANGQLKVCLGEPSLLALPERPAAPVNMTDVDIEVFYDSLAKIGYNYSQMFKGIFSLKRKMDTATGSIMIGEDESSKTPFAFHPATLDVAFQSIFAAIGAPGDGRLWTLHVPTMIKRIQVNPFAVPNGGGIGVQLPFNADLSVSLSNGISGDVSIYDEAGQNAVVQVEGLHVSPISTPTAADDRQIYAETVWQIANPDGELVVKEIPMSEAEEAAAVLVERLCFFYMKQLHETVSEEEAYGTEQHQTKVLKFAKNTVKQVSEGKHPTCKKEWLSDTYEELRRQVDEKEDRKADFVSVMAVGEKLAPFARGEYSFIDESYQENMLEQLYKDTNGFDEYCDYLGKMVKQISFRHQHMNILQIGAGTGDATAAILQNIGHTYAGYTYTDSSDAFFEDAQARFKGHSSTFKYKTLDIEKDFAEQEFNEHTYDLIIASVVLHATQSLEGALNNAHKLLKPGGYLLLLEVTNTGPLRTWFMASGLPEFWHSADDDRLSTSLMSQKQWDSILRRAAFSGIDTATPDSKTSMIPFSVMATQALDPQLSLIRQPLSLSGSKPIVDHLLILGGQTLPTHRLVDDVEGMLKSHCKEITVMDSLENLDMSVFQTKPVVLSLTELDEPVFNPFTPEKLTAVANLLNGSKNILWVVQGSTGENPYSNMMIAIGRCMIFEMPDLLMQFMDVDFSEKPSATLLTEYMLRLQIGESWKAAVEPYKPLWTVEREMRVSKGVITIPRYLPHEGPNDRFNSSKRLIRKATDLATSVLAVTSSGTSYDLQEYRSPKGLAIEDDAVTIQVRRSILSALKVKSVGYLHLIIGTDLKTQSKVLALSEDHRSTVSVRKNWCVPCDIDEDKESHLLVAVARQFLADAIIGNAHKGSSLLVHEAPPALASALKKRAADRRINVAFTTESDHPDFQRLHPSTLDRTIDACIPKNVSVFADLSGNTDADHVNRIGARIERRLPFNCKHRTGATLSSPSSLIASGASQDEITEVLESSYAKGKLEIAEEVVPAIAKDLDLKDIPDHPIKMKWLRVVDWTKAAEVPVRIMPAEYDVQFQNDKTYLLIGLTGELGLSLCRWMVNRGAKHIALTSRNPKIDQAWLNMMEAKGAVVRAFAMDITSKDSLLAVNDEINRTMPPIAGVANGAMVNNEGLISSMSHEDFNTSIKPKVDGSIFLDELFQDKDLDFFILFSSLAAVTGNIGQTPYSSANAFMGSLVAGRRQRGLVGSVMNLAGILGLGYITRRDASILERLLHMGYANISEWDFHQFFAEAVMAGHPDSGRNPEWSSGLTEVDPEKTESSPAWLYLPKFSHYRVVRPEGQQGGGGDDESVSVRTKLKEQTTEQGVYEVLLEGLLSTLYKQLKLSPEDQISPDTTIVELGVDSLVAVDMRSWFTNELEIDMPVLKLLGGATVAELAEDAQQRISRELIPNVGASEDSKAEKADAVKEETGATPPTKNENNPASEASSHPSTPSLEATDKEMSSSSSTSSSEEKDAAPKISITEAPETSKNVKVPERRPSTVAQIAKPAYQKYQKTTKMSYGASRFWFLRQYLEDPTTFNCIARTKLTGNLREADLSRAVEAVGQRHEAFRTAFFANQDKMNEPSQGVLAKSLLRLEKRTIKSEEEAIKETETMLKYTFDLERGESIRMMLLTLTPTCHFLIFGFHHIMIDGFSFNILVSDLNKLYAKQSLPPVSSQFTDFAIKKRKEVESGAMANELKFWRSEYPDFPEPLPLFPVSKTKSRMPLKKYEFEETEMVLDGKTMKAIRETCRRHKSTSFHFFLAVLKVWIFNFLDIDDVAIGMADANRTDNSTASTIGFLLNLLPLRFKKDATQTFGEALTEARTKAYAALGHSRLPFDVLLEEMNIPRSSAHSPLFQVFMDYRQIAVKTPTMLGAKADGVSAMGRTAYDLVLDVNEVAGSEVKVGFRTQKYLYSKDATNILFQSYIDLVKRFAASTDGPAVEAPLFPEVDVQKAIDLGRGRSLAPGWPATISHRIDNIVLDHGGSIALKDGVGSSMTYNEMAKRVDSICSQLSKVGVKEADKVAVFQEPTADWVCSMLAIWKAGGVYVPLELRNTLPRLAIIVSDCKPTAIICHDQTVKDVPALKPESANIVNVTELARASQSPVFHNNAQADAIAVILYTSGSTGTPKGIVLKHSGIANEMEGYSKEWKIGQENVLQQSAYSFDFSLDQMLTGLSNGGTVYVVPKAKRGDPIELAKLINNESISYTKATPSEYSSWIRYGADHLKGAKTWSKAFGGGEVLSQTLKQEFRSLEKRGLRLLNSYGPGEISISCTKAEIKYQQDSDYNEDPVPVGFALPNYALYVVDRHLNPVPVGVTGEVVIGGPGVCKGYLNNDELTKKKFIEADYVPQEHKERGWTTVYRSGDMGRLRSDGALLFEGRTDGDTQIKLRGIRIELEDIESTIVEASGGVINKAVASIRGDPQFLVAHVELASDYPFSEREKFCKDLKNRLPLPQYMCPAMVIPLDAIPLNNHAKTNRLAVNAMPLPEATASGEDAVLSDTEMTLKDVWTSVIGKQVIGMFTIDTNTDFFHVGGNSLLLVKLQAAIREKFDVALPMIELFEASKLSTMAAKVSNASSVVTIDWKTETALSNALVSSQTVDSMRRRVSTAAGSGLTVLLTGPTGFLGRHILQRLVADERVSTIHCVAVRNHSEEEPREIAVESDKVILHGGNLGDANLGLTDNMFAQLATVVDVVIHSGANRSFWDYYELLRGPNVESTKELTRLAVARKIPVHFISSGGVLGLAPEATPIRDAVSLTDFKPPVDGSMGYVASKWSSEAYLENAAAMLGLPIHIHRVTDDSTNNVGPSAVPEELKQEFSYLSSKLKTLPAPGEWNGTFDLIPVKPLAQQIVDAALDNKAGEGIGEGAPRFLHHAAELRLQMKDVADHLEDHEGKDTYERMPPHKWVGKAKALGISYHFATMDLGMGGEERLAR